MRQLTEQERTMFYNASNKLDLTQYSDDFEGGFIAGFDYQQSKCDELKQSYSLTIERIELFCEERTRMIKEINAYAAYVAGKITQKELEEVINADPIHDSALLK